VSSRGNSPALQASKGASLSPPLSRPTTPPHPTAPLSHPATPPLPPVSRVSMSWSPTHRVSNEADSPEGCSQPPPGERQHHVEGCPEGLSTELQVLLHKHRDTTPGLMSEAELSGSWWLMREDDAPEQWEGQLWFQPRQQLSSSRHRRGRWELREDGRECAIVMGGRQYHIWFEVGHDPYMPFSGFTAESSEGKHFKGRFLWSPGLHREQGLEASAGFAWLPGTLWHWSAEEVDLARFLPGGCLQAPQDRCAHWHQLEGHGLCAVYLQGRRYVLQFDESKMDVQDGLLSRSFVATPDSASAPTGMLRQFSSSPVIHGTRCLPSAAPEDGVMRGYLMKRSGRLLTEWRVRWVELNSRKGTLRYFEHDQTPMHSERRQATSTTSRFLASAKASMLNALVGHSGEVEAAGLLRLTGQGASLATLEVVEYSPAKGRLEKQDRPNSFVLAQDDKKHYFSCSSLEERGLWMDAISALLRTQQQHLYDLSRKFSAHRSNSSPFCSTGCLEGRRPSHPPAPGVTSPSTTLHSESLGLIPEDPLSELNGSIGAREEIMMIGQRIVEAQATLLQEIQEMDGASTPAASPSMPQLLPDMLDDRDRLATLCEAPQVLIDEEALKAALSWLDACDCFLEVTQHLPPHEPSSCDI